MTSTDRSPSLLLVGAGLANSLVALALLDARPALRLVLVERGPRPCGNHTWSFHATDVPDAMGPIVEPLLTGRWDRYDVCFPPYTRTLEIGYRSMHSERVAERLQAVVEAAPNAQLLCDTDVVEVTGEGVTLSTGENLAAELVLDGRGPEQRTHRSCGFQKFVGLEYAFDRPHGIAHPVLMDATVPQQDGYQFLYVLPFDEHHVLLEDTSFSPAAELDVRAGVATIEAIANARGLVGGRIVRREQGVLPMPWAGPGPQHDVDGPLRVGYAGGLFHPATGYSVPQALRFAALLAEEVERLGVFQASTAYARFIARERRQARFGRFLNRLLFTAIRGEGKRSVFERFYRLPEDLIQRFYAGQLRGLDRARLLVGKPPRGLTVKGVFSGSAQP